MHFLLSIIFSTRAIVIDRELVYQVCFQEKKDESLMGTSMIKNVKIDKRDKCAAKWDWLCWGGLNMNENGYGWGATMNTIEIGDKNESLMTDSNFMALTWLKNVGYITH